MTAIPPVPPGIRPVDPQAEADRLAEARKPAAATKAGAGILLSEVHQLSYDGRVIWFQVWVTAEEFYPVPADLGRKLADVVRENWPQL